MSLVLLYQQDANTGGPIGSNPNATGQPSDSATLILIMAAFMAFLVLLV